MTHTLRTVFCLLSFAILELELSVAKGQYDYPPEEGNTESISPSSWAFPQKLFAKGGNGFAGFIHIPERKHKKPSKLGGAYIVQSSHYELEYILGRKIIFICVANGNPRPRITWYKDGVELYAHNYFQVHEWKVGDQNIKSKMEIDPATPMDVGYYECQANNEVGVDHKGFRTKYTATHL